MSGGLRETALRFLLEEHLLSRDEAAQALAVADTILREGLSRLVGTVDAQSRLEAAHALKGNLLNLGLPELAAMAQAVVEAAKRSVRPGTWAGLGSLFS